MRGELNVKKLLTESELTDWAGRLPLLGSGS
jgi:hypothetical protein